MGVSNNGGTPIDGWFTMENPISKWVIWRYFMVPLWRNGNLHFLCCVYISSQPDSAPSGPPQPAYWADKDYPIKAMKRWPRLDPLGSDVTDRPTWCYLVVNYPRGGELPTDRCWWVSSPQLCLWTLPPQKSHENNQGCNPLRIRGMSHQVAPRGTSKSAFRVCQ